MKRIFLLLFCLVLAVPALHAKPPAKKRALEKPAKDATVEQRVEFYIKRVGDRGYVEYQNHDGALRPWYLAAEELGEIGLPAVAPLMKRLEATKDAYERTHVFYALRLAAQAPEINKALGQTLPEYPLAWPPEKDHAKLKKLWLDWWAKHGEAIQKLTPEKPSVGQ